MLLKLFKRSHRISYVQIYQCHRAFDLFGRTDRDSFNSIHHLSMHDLNYYSAYTVEIHNGVPAYHTLKLWYYRRMRLVINIFLSYKIPHDISTSDFTSIICRTFQLSKLQPWTNAWRKLEFLALFKSDLCTQLLLNKLTKPFIEWPFFCLIGLAVVFCVVSIYLHLYPATNIK